MEQGGWVVVCNGSGNGTFVNGLAQQLHRVLLSGPHCCNSPARYVEHLCRCHRMLGDRSRGGPHSPPPPKKQTLLSSNLNPDPNQTSQTRRLCACVRSTRGMHADLDLPGPWSHSAAPRPLELFCGAATYTEVMLTLHVMTCNPPPLTRRSRACARSTRGTPRGACSRAATPPARSTSGADCRPPTSGDGRLSSFSCYIWRRISSSFLWRRLALSLSPPTDVSREEHPAPP